MVRQARREKGPLMLAVLSVALVGLADAPTRAGQAVAPSAQASSQQKTDAIDACSPQNPDKRTIVICTQRPQGYRLNPDVMEAKRETHSSSRPVRPGFKAVPDCASVGPFPCVSAGIPIIGAALTAAEMAKRIAEGKEVGSMFVTDPHPSEYQLYQMAKARREAEEAEKAALAKAKAAQVKAATNPAAEARPEEN
jgi:hypothetical protein